MPAPRKRKPAAAPTRSSKRVRVPPPNSNAPTTTTALAPRRRKTDQLSPLPYHILLEIFLCAASNPKLPHDWPEHKFLLNLATVCRRFLAPALAALYRNPPTKPPLRAHQLLRTLRAHPELARKVQHLSLEAEPLLRLTAFGFGRFDVAAAAAACTNLRSLWIGGDGARWKYPAALFAALAGARLRSWHWDSAFLGAVAPAHAHAGALAGVTRLSVRGDGGVVAALGALPQLRELALEEWGGRGEELPGALRLTALTLTRCELGAAELAALLAAPACARLRALRVLNCAQCSLAILGALPPALEVLEFDGRAQAVALLPAGTRARWPAPLRALRLTYLQNWDGADLEGFLDELVAAAARMPMLRVFEIYGILASLGWRERARIRDEYEGRLRKAFVRADEMAGASGHCERDRVLIRFDNARPAERLFEEDDFE